MRVKVTCRYCNHKWPDYTYSLGTLECPKCHSRFKDLSISVEDRSMDDFCKDCGTTLNDEDVDRCQRCWREHFGAPL